MIPSIADLCVGKFTPCASVEMARPVMNLRLNEDEPTQLRPLNVARPNVPELRGDALRERLMRELTAKCPVRFFLDDLIALGVSKATASQVGRAWIEAGLCVEVGRVRRPNRGRKPQICFEWCK